MKKFAIDRLDIEIGRWCNMTCKHCYKGEREKIAIDEKFIEKFTDEIYLVNHLYFCGGEAMFYLNKIEAILEIFKNKNIPINFIRVNSNIKEKNERFVDLLNKIPDYSQFPNETKLIISSDEFHVEDIKENGENEYFEENKKWYKEHLHPNIIFRENDGSDMRISLNGKAKDLPRKYLDFFITTQIFSTKDKGKIVKIKTINDNKSGKIENCIMDWIQISSEGYIFSVENLSYEEQRENDYFMALGHVYDGSLKNMIKKWNEECNKNEEISPVVNKGNFLKLLDTSLDYIPLIEKCVNEYDDFELDNLAKKIDSDIECYKKYLDDYLELFGGKGRKNDGILHAFMSLAMIKDTVSTLKDIPNGFFRKLGMKVFLSQKDKEKE